MKPLAGAAAFLRQLGCSIGPARSMYSTDALIDQRINGPAGNGGAGPLSGITSAQRGHQGSGQTALTSS